MMKWPVWICMPHAKVMMQIRQPANDVEEDDVANDEDSRKVKSTLPDVIEQIPKTDETENSGLFSERSKNGVSMFHVRPV